MVIALGRGFGLSLVAEVLVLTVHSGHAILVAIMIKPDGRYRRTRPAWYTRDKGMIVTVHRTISAGRHSLLDSDFRGRVALVVQFASINPISEHTQPEDEHFLLSR